MRVQFTFVFPQTIPQTLGRPLDPSQWCGARNAGSKKAGNRAYSIPGCHSFPKWEVIRNCFQFVLLYYVLWLALTCDMQWNMEVRCRLWATRPKSKVNKWEVTMATSRVESNLQRHLSQWFLNGEKIYKKNLPGSTDGTSPIQRRLIPWGRRVEQNRRKQKANRSKHASTTRSNKQKHNAHEWDAHPLTSSQSLS